MALKAERFFYLDGGGNHERNSVKVLRESPTVYHTPAKSHRSSRGSEPVRGARGGGGAGAGARAITVDVRLATAAASAYTGPTTSDNAASAFKSYATVTAATAVY